MQAILLFPLHVFFFFLFLGSNGWPMPQAPHDLDDLSTTSSLFFLTLTIRFTTV
jgi:hypothetical protein